MPNIFAHCRSIWQTQQTGWSLIFLNPQETAWLRETLNICADIESLIDHATSDHETTAAHLAGWLQECDRMQRGQALHPLALAWLAAWQNLGRAEQAPIAELGRFIRTCQSIHHSTNILMSQQEIERLTLGLADGMIMMAKGLSVYDAASHQWLAQVTGWMVLALFLMHPEHERNMRRQWIAQHHWYAVGVRHFHAQNDWRLLPQAAYLMPLAQRDSADMLRTIEITFWVTDFTQLLPIWHWLRTTRSQYKRWLKQKSML